jgi:hypothetical protein
MSSRYAPKPRFDTSLYVVSRDGKTVDAPTWRSFGAESVTEAAVSTSATTLTDQSATAISGGQLRRARLIQTIEELLKQTRARNESAVRQFLVDNDDLLQSVEDALARVGRVFGRDASGIILWVNGDETGDSYLAIGIETSLSAREAIDRLHATEAEWLPETDSFTREHILLTLVMKK